MRDDNICVEGRIVEIERDRFKVELANGEHVLCTISGKMRHANIRVILYDKVHIRCSPYDLTRGIIVYRC